jgi:hypothetical protein
VVAVAVIAIAGLAVGSYALLGGQHPGGQDAATQPPSQRTSTSPSLVADHPAHVVEAYFKAINQHHFLRAWRLGGKNTGLSFGSFVAGFVGTRHDTVRIMSARGQVVMAHLTAIQTDGTIKTFQGSYTVSDGAIAASDVHRTS